STSVKSDGEVFLVPIRWIPRRLQLQNYALATTVIPFWQYAINSVHVTVLVVLGAVGSSSLVAYAFARLRARLRSFLFIVLLSRLMLPSEVTLVSTYLIFKNLGWVDTYNPLIVPAYFGNAFYIFMLRQFYLTLPVELDRRGEDRRLRLFRHLRPHHRAALQAGAGHRRHLLVLRELERVPGAADLPQHDGEVHAAGRPDVLPRPVHGNAVEPDDGRVAAGDDPLPGRLLRRAAHVHPGRGSDRHQGLTPTPSTARGGTPNGHSGEDRGDRRGQCRVLAGADPRPMLAGEPLGQLGHVRGPRRRAARDDPPAGHPLRRRAGRRPAFRAHSRPHRRAARRAVRDQHGCAQPRRRGGRPRGRRAQRLLPRRAGRDPRQPCADAGSSARRRADLPGRLVDPVRQPGVRRLHADDARNRRQ